MSKVSVFSQHLPYAGLRNSSSRIGFSGINVRKWISKTTAAVKGISVHRTSVPGVINPKRARLFLAYGLIAVNAALFVLYFFGVNQGVAESYELKQEQTKISKLQNENQQLTLKSSEVGSILRVQQELAASGFVPASGGIYVEPHQYSQR